MAQLSLNITPCLAYSSENFMLHQGVKTTFEGCLALIGSAAFRIGFIVGGPRCGKTHFSIKVSDTLVGQGAHPRLIEGSGLGEWIQSHADMQFIHDDVLIVDDAQHYLSRLGPGDSGELVAFIEKLRVSRAALILLSSQAIDRFSFDDHIRSRLLPGDGFEVAAPKPDDMAELLRLMAKQRGLSLSDRKVDFLEKRIPRDIAEIEAYLERLEGLSRVTGKRIGYPMLGDAV